MATTSSVVPYASWLLDAAKHLWPVAEIISEFYLSTPLLVDWRRQPMTLSVDLTLKTFLIFSNFASAALSFKTYQHERAVMARIANFSEAWKHGQEYLKGSAKKFLTSPSLNAVPGMNSGERGLPDEQVENLIETATAFIEHNIPLYKNFCRFVALEDRKAASQTISKLQLFSMLMCFGQYLRRKQSDAEASEFFIYHVLQYGSTALDCYLMAHQTSAKTSSLAFEIFRKIVGVFPWMIRSIIAYKMFYPAYLAGIELKKMKPIVVKTFGLVKYQFPPSPQDSSLQYPQIPNKYHQHDPFKQHICPLGNKPITQALFIVEISGVMTKTAECYIFEKATLVQYIFQTQGPLTNRSTGKEFTRDNVYIDTSFNDSLMRHFLHMMKAELRDE
jgi:hypothetical protein